MKATTIKQNVNLLLLNLVISGAFFLLASPWIGIGLFTVLLIFQLTKLL